MLVVRPRRVNFRFHPDHRQIACPITSAGQARSPTNCLSNYQCRPGPRGLSRRARRARRWRWLVPSPPSPPSPPSRAPPAGEGAVSRGLRPHLRCGPTTCVDLTLRAAPALVMNRMTVIRVYSKVEEAYLDAAYLGGLGVESTVIDERISSTSAGDELCTPSRSSGRWFPC
jgi:hypothetical protein